MAYVLQAEEDSFMFLQTMVLYSADDPIEVAGVFLMILRPTQHPFVNLIQFIMRSSSRLAYGLSFFFLSRGHVWASKIVETNLT